MEQKPLIRSRRRLPTGGTLTTHAQIHRAGTLNSTTLRPVKYVLATLLTLCVGAVVTAQASSTIITFSVDMAQANFIPGTDSVYVFGTFNGWSGPGLQLVQQGSSTVYTNSYNDTRDANGGVVDYRFNINGNNESTACWDNRAAHLPSTSGATLVLPTPYYGDVGPGVVINVTFQVDMSEEIELGHFIPGVNQVDVRGSFNGWGNTGAYLTNDPTILVTNHNFPGGLVESNVYTLTVPITSGAQVPGVPATNAMMEWKAVEDVGAGNSSSDWESPGPANADDANNRFWCNSTNQVLPIVSFGDLPYSPLANVTLNLDMSGVIRYDTNYVPGSVSVWGTFNNWASGIPMTNNPASPNPNLFSAGVSMGEGAGIIYQFRYTNSALNGWIYDYGNDEVYNDSARRSLLLPITATRLNTNVPPVFFLDLAPNDYLPQATPVLFSVDMNGAIGTDGHVFDPTSDALYINGMFANFGYPQLWYTWAGTANSQPTPPGYQMVEVGTTTVYTNTIILPPGTVVALSYQYGIDPAGAYGGPLENEAAAGNNHVRVVRSTASDSYTMPIDTFGFQYNEPFFSTGNIQGLGNLGGGNLSVGLPVAGKVAVQWLGRPGGHLQVNTSLASGAWRDLTETDGTNWTSGFASTNGFVSQTNWPAGQGNSFFRLVKPN
ncbi:exported hypothetical protein [Verrucomicrobia bacterium]|nr:exported hypothetical protein [Verrucomicrobiota bacterium]